jgi:tetratricopeptide (TPR) repeat protein
MDAKSLTRQAIELKKAGDTAGAVKLLAQAVEADAQFEVAWFWLASCLSVAAEQRYCVEQALAINSDSQAARAALEKFSHVQSVRPTVLGEDKTTMAQDALDIDAPDIDTTAATPAPTKKRARKRRELTATELVEQGNRRLAGHRKALARESFTKAVELEPQCEGAHMGLALTAIDEQDRREHLQRVLALNPNNVTARQLLNSLERLLNLRADLERQSAYRQAANQQRQQRPTHQQPVYRASTTRTPVTGQASRIPLLILGCVLAALFWYGTWLSSPTPVQPTPSFELGPGPGAPVRVYTSESSLITPSPIERSPNFYVGGSGGGSLCADGTHSSSTGRGTCSHHGGVVGH